MPASSPEPAFDQVLELGAVTDKSVRLWLRWSGQPMLEAELRVEGQPPVAGVAALSGEDDWVGSVDLALPESAPGNAFTVTVAGQSVSGVLAPTPGARTGLTFGFGSCHQPFIEQEDGGLARKPEAAIYEAFRADLARYRARLLVLVGDQIYADGLPALSVHQADGQGEGAALAAYRRVYHYYFADPGMRALRAAVPTLCLWDDHDILNNWGSRGGDEADAVLFRAACRTYEQYQHARNPALWRERGAGSWKRDGEERGQRATGDGQRADGDLPRTGQGPPYPFAYSYGDIAFLGLDLRGARDVDEGSLLGREQWRRVEAFLAGGEARAATLFVVCTVPLAHPARWFTRLLERAPGGYGASVRDRWAASAFVEERDRLLAALFAWQAEVPHRQVCLLSGDIHAGGAMEIRQRRGPGIIHQFISSAFTSELSLVSRTAIQVGALLPNLGERELRFRRRWLEYRRNYGLVRVRPAREGGHRVEFVLKAWEQRRGKTRVRGRVRVG